MGQEISVLKDFFFTFERSFVTLALDFFSNPDCPREWNPLECWDYTAWVMYNYLRTYPGKR